MCRRMSSGAANTIVKIARVATAVVLVAVVSSHPAATLAQHGVSQVAVELSGAVSGKAAPRATIEVRVVDTGGVSRGRWVGKAFASGAFFIKLDVGGTGPGVVALQVGDRVEVDELGGGDPVLIAVPELSVQTDVASDRLSGVAPARSQVTLEVWKDGQASGSLTGVSVPADGRFDVSLRGKHDLVKASLGRIVVSLAGGHQVSRFWVAHALDLYLQNGSLVVRGAPNASVALDVIDEAGVLRGSARTRMSGDDIGGLLAAPQDGANLVDRFNRPVRLEPGWVIRGQVGDETVSLTVPPLTLVADIENDTISGTTSPRMSLRATAYRASTQERIASPRLTADMDGAFTVDLAGLIDVRYYDSLRAELFPNERYLLVAEDIALPGLTLDLDTSRITGLVEPGIEVSADLKRAGHPVAGGAARTDADGNFDLVLRGPSGSSAAAEPGDILTLTAPAAQRFKEIMLKVPELAFDLDPDANAVSGTATDEPGMLLELRSFILPGSGELNWTRRLTRQGERFAIDFDEHQDILPPTMSYKLGTGSLVRGTIHMPMGHRVTRRRIIPQFNVQLGGGKVCGSTWPLASIEVTLLDTNRVIRDRVATAADLDGQFETSWHAGAGKMIVPQAGEQLHFAVDRETFEIAMPPFDMAVDWPGKQFHATTLPDRTISLTYPGDIGTCLSSFVQGIAPRVIHLGGRTDRDGRVDVDLAPVAPLVGEGGLASGLHLSMFLPDGHRLFTGLYPIQGELHIRRDHIRGRATAGQSMTATVLSESGAPLGDGVSQADSRARYDLRVRDLGGTPLMLREGQRVVMLSATERVTVTLEALDFDFSPTSGVDGTAPPGRLVRLGLTLRTGEVLTTTLKSDPAGRFAFRNGDFGPGASVSLNDVTEIRAVLPIDAYFSIVASWESNPPSPTPAPTPSPTPTQAPPMPTTATPPTMTPISPGPTPTSLTPVVRPDAIIFMPLCFRRP